MLSESNDTPEVCAIRCRTVDPGGPAGSSSEISPRSIAVRTVNAVTGLVTEAQGSTASCGPVAASTPDALTTATAAVRTGQLSTTSSDPTLRGYRFSLVETSPNGRACEVSPSSHEIRESRGRRRRPDGLRDRRGLRPRRPGRHLRRQRGRRTQAGPGADDLVDAPGGPRRPPGRGR